MTGCFSDRLAEFRYIARLRRHRSKKALRFSSSWGVNIPAAAREASHPTAAALDDRNLQARLRESPRDRATDHPPPMTITSLAIEALS